MKSKRKKKIYSLTTKGKKLLKQFFQETSLILESMIKEKLKTCKHCKCKIYGNAYGEIIGGKKYYFCCKYCAEAFKK